MTFDRSAWKRLEFERTPIYVRDCPAGWFVPNAAGDRLLREQLTAMPVKDFQSARFLERLPKGGRSHYPGRAIHLAATHLRELWFHLTDRCNMACRHCLFSSSPSTADELPLDIALHHIAEARELGCRIFAFTGGEPMLYPRFTTLIDAVLDHPNAHAVVLTNGTLLKQHEVFLRHHEHERLHLQISLDGLQPRHDAVRGTGAFDVLKEQLALLRKLDFPFTLSMCVDSANADDMPTFVETAAKLGAANVHFMWLFVRGRAGKDRFATPDRLFENLRQADERAQHLGIGIDNIDAFKTQAFAPAGTLHDGTTSGSESAAIGPDGKLYPSAALIGVEELATPVTESLAKSLRTSPVLKALRKASISALDSPLRALTGGGDSDHSYSHSRTFIGNDPYVPLHEKIILWLIAREAGVAPDNKPRLRLKMGDILESCGAHGPVALVHSNCLLATAHHDSRTAVKEYYSDAAENTHEDILNPVCYPEELMAHIPHELRFRGYGCGSPVLDASPGKGECVVDLGCGRGIECYIAARLVGPTGRVIGIDMLNPMLAIARDGAKAVSQRLEYDNLDFRKGYLEELPVDDASADLIVSNCVLNLSADKRRTFSEIFRVLKPGGRLMVSDVVCETEPDPVIRNDDVLRGECIAGALTQHDLSGLLDETGFDSFRVIRRFPYRDIMAHRFFSMTYEAVKPTESTAVHVIYPGPARALVRPNGKFLFAGITATMPKSEALRFGDTLVLLDSQGSAVNMDWQNACACAAPDHATALPPDTTASPAPHAEKRKTSGCMFCGAPLQYISEELKRTCVYCGQTTSANAICERGHFVCDACHAADAVVIIRRICESAEETDMIALMQRIRSHDGIPLHGPEHHSLVPAVILTAYRNLGGRVTPGMIDTAIHRGSQVMGGACAFTGICGAAAGAGIAFSMILDANPLTSQKRQQIMQSVQHVAQALAEIHGARCCQRDAWIALRKAAELSKTMLPIPLQANAPLRCKQSSLNPQCICAACPLFRP